MIISCQCRFALINSKDDAKIKEAVHYNGNLLVNKASPSSCPQKVDGIALDPEPDWSFEALLSEIDELERKINSPSKVSVPFTKEKPLDISDSKSNGRTSASPFVMGVFEDKMDNIDSEDEKAHDQNSVVVKWFNFDDLYLRAEAHHLTAVQRDLEVRSQTEERKIRIDAAYKDAKRREKALQEEKLRQERAKAEAEVFLFGLFMSLLFCWQKELRTQKELLWKLREEHLMKLQKGKLLKPRRGLILDRHKKELTDLR